MKKEETKKNSYSKQGKLNRASGRRFEAKVRKNLEDLGWIIDKWTNTVDYEREGKIGKVVPAKRKYNPFRKVMVIGTGFPDFVCFRKIKEEGIFDVFGEQINSSETRFEVIGLEVKSNGYLGKIEKDMCLWLLEHQIFSRILIAKKGKKRGEIEYIDFGEKYGKKI